MKFKGTKGQWVITEENSNGIIESSKAINIQQNENDFFDICAVWRDVSFNSKECQYNALLISKAPEMLEMLDRCLSMCDKRQYPTEQELNSMAIDIQQLIKEATEL